MDRITEEYFVKTFIVRQCRQRLLMEFASPKRRQTGLLRFCHDAASYIIPATIFYRGNKLSKKEIEQTLRPHSERAMCYALSTNETIDGKFLPISQALDAALGFGMPSILVCTHAVLIECEQSYGPAEKLILVQK